MIKMFIHRLLPLLALANVTLSAGAQLSCDLTGACGSDGTEAKYDVVAPVGLSAVKSIEMALRLDRVDGKTIALVGGSFMAGVTHVELRKIILEQFPNCKVYVLSEVGSAGLFPGPVARQLRLDHGQGQINQPANVAIGRFLNLAMLNLAGYNVKQDRMGTFGYPVAWCMAEDDEACVRVGWNPYHVRMGYDINTSTVTAASTLLWGNNMPPATTDAHKIMQLMAWDIIQRCQLALGSGKQFTHRTILMTEEVAANLSRTYTDVNSLEDALIVAARRPLYERAYANYYANPGSAINPDRVTFDNYMRRLQSKEGAQMTDTPEWCASDDRQMMTIPTMQKGETAFIITGDASRNKIQTMPGGQQSTVAIELPKNWDKLMAERGYEPLNKFMLKSLQHD